MASKPVLFNGEYCPYSQRAWISFEEKGCQYERREVRADEMYHTGTKTARPTNEKPQDFIAVNPYGTVPALSHGGFDLWESLVCVEYIDEALEGNPLLPHDPSGKAEARLFATIANSNVATSLYPVIGAESDEKRQGAIQEMHKKMKGFFDLVSKRHRAGYILGDQFSLADIALYPFALRMRVYGEPLGAWFPKTDEFARFHEWFELCAQRPSVQRASPSDKYLQDFIRRPKKEAA